MQRGPADDALQFAGVLRIGCIARRLQAAREAIRFSYTEHGGIARVFLQDNPRYAGVLGVREPDRFARGLQAAGYATDPQYASKLARIISGPTLRQAMYA